MASKKDSSGHSTNVNNLREVINVCSSFNSDYNPAREDLKLPALTAMLQNADTILAGVKINATAFDNATDQRVITFKPFKPIISRAYTALKASGAAEETVNNAKTVYNQVHGRRATPKKESTVPVEGAEAEPDKSVSVSKQKHDDKIEQFEKILTILRAEPKYAPNEEDLKIATLEAFLQNMKDVNNAVSLAQSNVDTARSLRKDTFYLNLGCLVDIANAVKLYVKSVYGASSDQYKRVQKIRFKKILK